MFLLYGGYLKVKMKTCWVLQPLHKPMVHDSLCKARRGDEKLLCAPPGRVGRCSWIVCWLLDSPLEIKCVCRPRMSKLLLPKAVYHLCSHQEKLLAAAFSFFSGPAAWAVICCVTCCLCILQALGCCSFLGRELYFSSSLK
ncbi:hypothetical protein V8G54_005555 [Vigna mungo]|uniref:Uncharacterized protein n=1 Tax=Vigna mungo TaxID=3915 RepID=A0AAQ3P1Q5_VIGMU